MKTHRQRVECIPVQTLNFKIVLFLYFNGNNIIRLILDFSIREDQMIMIQGTENWMYTSVTRILLMAKIYGMIRNSYRLHYHFKHCVLLIELKCCDIIFNCREVQSSVF